MAIQKCMKSNRFTFPPYFRFALPLLLAALCLTCVSCASKDINRPTGAPVSYDPSIRRDAGVLNDPVNTGNSPQDLSPYTPHWGDVRPGY